MLKYFFSCLLITNLTIAQVGPQTQLPSHPRLLMLKNEERVIQNNINSDKNLDCHAPIYPGRM